MYVSFETSIIVGFKIGSDIDGEAPSEFVGTSVSLSSDGTVVAVGAPGNGRNGNSRGM